MPLGLVQTVTRLIRKPGTGIWGFSAPVLHEKYLLPGAYV